MRDWLRRWGLRFVRTSTSLFALKVLSFEAKQRHNSDTERKSRVASVSGRHLDIQTSVVNVIVKRMLL